MKDNQNVELAYFIYSDKNLDNEGKEGTIKRLRRQQGMEELFLSAGVRGYFTCSQAEGKKLAERQIPGNVGGTWTRKKQQGGAGRIGDQKAGGQSLRLTSSILETDPGMRIQFRKWERSRIGREKRPNKGSTVSKVQVSTDYLGALECKPHLRARVFGFQTPTQPFIG